MTHSIESPDETSDRSTFELTSWQQVSTRSLLATVSLIVLAPLPALAIYALSGNGPDDGFVASIFWGNWVWWLQVTAFLVGLIVVARGAKDPLLRAWGVLWIVVGYLVAGIIGWSVQIGGFDLDLVAFLLHAQVFISVDGPIAAIVAALALFLKRHSRHARYR
ncbi:MAG: hypothetical protein ACTMIK_09120 [Galactobacter sp.]